MINGVFCVLAEESGGTEFVSSFRERYLIYQLFSILSREGICYCATILIYAKELLQVFFSSSGVFCTISSEAAGLFFHSLNTPFPSIMLLSFF